MDGTGTRRQFIPEAARLSSRAAFVCVGVAPAQHSASFAGAEGRARIQPEAERTVAFAHGLGERGKRQWSWAVPLSARGPFLHTDTVSPFF
jgi:hypothetical protein